MKFSRRLATLLLALIMVVSLAACGGGQGTDNKGKENKPAEPVEKEVQLKRIYTATPGKDGFGRYAVAMEGDKIVAAKIDEFQFGDVKDGGVFVPNSDKAFAKGYAEGKALYSKAANGENYSKKMKEFAGATMTLEEGLMAIENFVVGKTVADLEKVTAEAKDGKPVDAVSGATLVNTKEYLTGIIEAAKSSEFVTTAKTTEDLSKAKIGQAVGAPHGDKSFSDTVALVVDGKVIAANLDEFQFLAEGKGVPNSDQEFGKNYAEGVILASKKVNNESYSANMKEKAQATKPLADSYKAIEEFTAGKTIADIEKVVSEAKDGRPVDAVSESTLVDTKGYLQVIVDAAKAVK